MSELDAFLQNLVWRTPAGEAIGCTEKRKVLRENLEELAQMLKDTLDDALLMGVSERQVREVFHALIDCIESDFSERDD